MKYPKISLHNHTNFCDGRDSAEEMVRQAIQMGLETVGFSGHSFTSFDPSYCMSRENTVRYREELARLKAVYADRIEILSGIERDFYADEDDAPYDYVIGSVHYIVADDGAICPIDESPEQIRSDVERHFGGNIYQWTRRYYETVAELAKKTNCNIAGHFDLVQKFNERDRLFDSGSPQYRLPLLDAMESLAEANVIFEINTGAICRGYRTVPYPESGVLCWLAQHHASVVITSDAHRKEDLTFGFESAALYAKACGIGGFTVPRKGSWITVPIGREA